MTNDSAETHRLMKWRRELRDATEELDRLDTDELRRAVVRAETRLYEVEIERAKDADLQEAKAKTAGLAAPYKDAVKHQRARIGYALWLLEQRGAEEVNE